MDPSAVNKIRSYFEDLIHDRMRLLKSLVIILLLMSALVLRIHETNKADITLEDNTADTKSGGICVDIGGAVVKPGVYTVSENTRLYEVIELAGGLLSNADTDSINRAEYVEDGEKITIPVIYIPPEQADPETAGADNIQISEEGETAEAGISSTNNGLVNINSASKEELKSLNGIGDAKADKIIEYRSESRFRKKEDIKDVDGIGDSIYNKIKDAITV